MPLDLSAWTLLLSAAFAAGVLNPDVMISDRYPLEDYPRALDQFKQGIGRKIQVNPNLPAG